MNNKELMAGINVQTGMNDAEITEMLNALSAVVGSCLTANDSLVLHGLGTFEVKKKGERVSVHPVSGKRFLVPPKLSPVFKPGGTLKTRIKEITLP